jgi:hypothetical protein
MPNQWLIYQALLVFLFSAYQLEGQARVAFALMR